MPARSKASKGQMGNRKAKTAYERKKAAAAASVSVADGTAARARTHCARPRLASDLHLRLHRALPHRRDRLLHARAARPHRLTARVPHPYRADRPIKKKPQGRRTPPAGAVTKWLIIDTLERATLEEILQFAFCVCDA